MSLQQTRYMRTYHSVTQSQWVKIFSLFILSLNKVLSSTEQLFPSFHISVMKTRIKLLKKSGGLCLGIFPCFVLTGVVLNLPTVVFWLLLTVYYIVLSHMNYGYRYWYIGRLHTEDAIQKAISLGSFMDSYADKLPIVNVCWNSTLSI